MSTSNMEAKTNTNTEKKQSQGHGLVDEPVVVECVQQHEIVVTIPLTVDNQNGKTVEATATSTEESSTDIIKTLPAATPPQPSVVIMEKTDSKHPKTENNNDIANSLVDEVNQLNISDELRQDSNESAVIVNKENNSLKCLMVYDSDESSTPSSIEANWQLNAVHSSSSSSSGTEISSDSSLSEDDDSDEEIAAIEKLGAIKKKSPKAMDVLKTPGELMFNDLPPVPDPKSFHLNLDDTEFVHMGYILAIMDVLVTVEALPDTPAYDLETLLFVGDDKKPLGQVFDVLGPVSSPIYAIRFNSPDEIARMDLQKGLQVFSSPKSGYTQYVFLKELLRIKGSDASWIGDNEVPPEMEEFSDDELEHSTGRQRGMQGKKRPHSSLERHRRFERTMNQCNTLNTRVQRLMDSQHPATGGVIRPEASNVQQEVAGVPGVVVFDPRVPPPFFPMTPTSFADVSRRWYDYNTQSDVASLSTDGGGYAATAPPNGPWGAGPPYDLRPNYFSGSVRGRGYPGPSNRGNP